MEKKVNDILESARGNKYDVYYILYNECILNSKSPDKTLRQILTFSKNIGTDDDSEPENISAKEIKNIEQKYMDLIHEIVQVLIEDNPTEEDFYKKLYENVFVNSIFPQDVKAILVKILAEDVRFIPYYQAKNLMQMTNDDYKIYLEKLKPDIFKAVHMLNRNFATLTEIASQLYSIEGNLETEQDKIVFISAVLGVIMHRHQENEDSEDDA